MKKDREFILEALKLFNESEFNWLYLEFEDIKIRVSTKAEMTAFEQVLNREKLGVGPEHGHAPSFQVAASPAEMSSVGGGGIEPAPSPGVIPADAIPEGLVAVRSPMLGTMYRSPGPKEKPFVDVGDHVEPEETVFLIDVMKLLNSVSANVSGTIVKFLVENDTLVEFGQPILLIEPDRGSS